MTVSARTDEGKAAAKPVTGLGPERRRNHVGSISLVLAAAGAGLCHLAARNIAFAGDWLPIIIAGFDAALVGGLADWFAVTALFRHPLGIPIPHTAILPQRRARIVEGIAAMVEREWLSPEVIGARLASFQPSAFLSEWLGDPDHVRRLAAPVRDVLRSAARLLNDTELVSFVDQTLQHQLQRLPIDGASGRWLLRFLESERATTVFAALAQSVANLADHPDTAAHLRTWLQRTARTLRQEGKVLVPLFLRRRIVQRKLVEAACAYASVELRRAIEQAEHPLRQTVLRAARSFADRLTAGDAATLAQIEDVRRALIESLEARPLITDLLTQLRGDVERDLDGADGPLSRLIERQLRSGILEALEEPSRRAAFDRWVRTTADDLVRRHHHQIGLTVRENLEALDTQTLIAQIEDRVGPDLQYIRLNGALVGGLIGVALALIHRALG